LLDRGADIESKDNLGKTALHAIVRSNNLEAVRLLLEKGADIEAKDRYGKTALMYAEKKGNIKAIQLLQSAILANDILTGENKFDSIDNAADVKIDSELVKSRIFNAVKKTLQPMNAEKIRENKYLGPRDKEALLECIKDVNINKTAGNYEKAYHIGYGESEIDKAGKKTNQLSDLPSSAMREWLMPEIIASEKQARKDKKSQALESSQTGNLPGGAGGGGVTKEEAALAAKKSGKVSSRGIIGNIRSAMQSFVGSKKNTAQAEDKGAEDKNPPSKGNHASKHPKKARDRSKSPKGPGR